MEKPEIWEEANYYWHCPECKKLNDANDENDSFLICNGDDCDYIYDEDLNG